MLGFWVPALAKAVLTALVVVLASALAEAFGPFWGALVASLPVSAGPAYVFLAMQHDGDFVAASALSSFAANAATGLFLIVYAIQARRLTLWPGLGMAVATWLIASLLIRQIAWTPATAILLNLIIYGSGFLTLKGIATTTAGPGTLKIRRWFDTPLRAAAIALFVSGVVLASSMLGPEVTGIATVFPISLTSVIVILQPRIGGPASVLLATTALRAMLGFGLALLALHLEIRPWGVTMALFVALAVSVSWSGGLLILKGRSRVGQALSPAKNDYLPKRLGQMSVNPEKPSIQSTSRWK
jgi:hypothetical protein